MTATPVVVVHGGAGALGHDIRNHRDECRRQLVGALATAQHMLEAGESALIAAKRAVELMEDYELFNAGYGSALCDDGTVQMSAALMRGADRQAGAVAGVRTVRHPIHAALAVFESRQVLMVGTQADRCALERGAEQRPNDSFITDRQRRHLAGRPGQTTHGTVGAVCLDGHGELAAATSTGGVTGQPPGRVGDSPLIGAGTWADGRVAISCTGDGEAFIRAGTARQVASLIENGTGVSEAAGRALSEVQGLGGRGGLIALTAEGEVAMPFNTVGMLRGVSRSGEGPVAWVVEPG